MPNRKLQSVVNDLNQYFNVSTKEDLVLDILSPSTINSGGTVNRTVLGKVAENIMSVAEGGLTTAEILEQFSSFASPGSEADGRLAELISIYAKQGTSSGLAATQDTDLEKVLGEKNANKLAIIMMKDINLLPAGRDNNAVTLFMNSIPTLEFSKCVPYLDIKISVGRSPLSNKKQVQALSLAKFLEGSFNASKNSGDEILTLALGDNPGDQNKSSTTISGMELFTTPQTLVNANGGFTRATSVIDKFRPFLTIEEFRAEISPHVGFFAYYTADLNLILHDRSRLADIADFIRPDLYSNTEMLIEYGWSHPDKSDANVYGRLLNNMRLKHKFRVVNSSFNFTKGGQVKLKLKLATKGASDMLINLITDGDEVMAAADAVRKIQQKISDLRNRVEQRKQGIKEVRGQQSLFSMAEDLSSVLTLSGEQRKQLNTLVGRRRNGKESNEIKQLKNELQELFGPGTRGRNGKAQDFLNSLTGVIEKRIKNVIQNPDLEDPMLDLDTLATRLDSSIKKELNKSKKKNYVSLSKLISIFVGVPLAQSANYTDVQLLFYPFNEKAGAAANLNIGSFAINVNELRRALNAIARARRGIRVPLREFIQFVFNNFIDDMGSINYGLKGLYNTEIDERTGTRKLLSKKFDDPTKMLNEQEIRISNIHDGIFRMPVIDVLIETVPGAVVDTGDIEAIKNEQTILKIHFFDKTATRYAALGDRYKMERDNSLQTLGDRIQQLTDDSAFKTYNDFINAMSKENLITKVNNASPGSEKLYEVAGGTAGVKKFITDSMPTITYGTNNSAIINASFRTIQEALLSTIHMIRAGDAGPLSPTGLSPGNLPLQTLPATVSMETWGCPLVYYMQQFFIDFKTNTTIDNIYGVNKFVHTISQGKFKSSWELVPLDAYGEYKSLTHHIGVALKAIEEIEKNSQSNEN